jgi:hypothetical protein
MTRYGKQAAAAVALLLTALAATPAASAHDFKNRRVDAKLYEVTENMTLDNLGAPTQRTAVAALQGVAKLGSPLCPVDLVQFLVGYELLVRADKPCTITALGSDAVDLQTGSGELKGSFQVVVNLDNTTDAPEFVVMTGTFKGDMQVLVDMSANPPAQLPLIALTNGVMTPGDVLNVPIAHLAYALGLDPASFVEANFTGVFRLPFSVDRRGKRFKAHPHRDAYYLGDRGQLIRVQPDERSLGFPTVRVEIDF